MKCLKTIDLFRRTADHEPHPLAELLPNMAEAEFWALVQNIRTHGLLHPIVIFEGKILDGRHRLRACLEAGVEPRFIPFEGEDPLAYVVAANVARRHLNPAQRALSAARLASLRRGQKATNTAFAVTQADAAKQFAVSIDTIQRARVVLEEGDERLIERVNKGTMSIGAAYAILRPSLPTGPEASSLFTGPDNDNEALVASRQAVMRDLEKLDIGFAGMLAKLSLEEVDVSSEDIKDAVKAMRRVVKSCLSRLRTC